MWPMANCSVLMMQTSIDVSVMLPSSMPCTVCLDYVYSIDSSVYILCLRYSRDKLFVQAVLCCGLQSNVAASNAKLALFYDWFFFDAEKDSIMNIGNGLLV